MLRRGFTFAILLLLGTSPAFSQSGQKGRRPRTRSHRSRPRIPKPLVPVKPQVPREEPAEVLARPEILMRALPKTRRLAKGRWKSSVADALERVLEYSGEGDPKYSPGDPPVVALSFEDVVVNGHVGLAVFQRMVRRADFKFNKAFWKRIPLQYGRARIHAGYEGFKNAEKDTWTTDPYYRMYRKGMLRAYRSICETAGDPACKRWIASLLMNYTEGELRRYSRDTLVEELDRPLGFETIGDYTEDPAPERERTGIRLIPEMLDLLTQLQRRGFDIWVMSTSNDWSATIFAAEIGIHPTRVVGIRVKVDDSFLGEEPLIPTPTGAGAAEALTLFVGRTPVLAIASTADTEILSYGHGARIALIDKPLAAEIATEWRRRGWFVQSAFSPIRAPQVLPRSAAAATAAPAP